MRLFDLLGLEVRALGEEEACEIDALLVRCADFIRLSEGHDPAPGDGMLLLEERPASAPEVEKLVLGLYDGPCLIGILDLLRDYPAPGVWHLGLMLIEPPRRRAGIGAALLAALGEWISGQGGRVLRLGVVEQNAAGHRFWARQGFSDIAQVDQDLGPFRRRVLWMERKVAAP
jgi:GNAT superfamily N-acetyltransferase